MNDLEDGSLGDGTEQIVLATAPKLTTDDLYATDLPLTQRTYTEATEDTRKICQ
jgi:hypothetical protein